MFHRGEVGKDSFPMSTKQWRFPKGCELGEPGLFLDGYLQPLCQIKEAGKLWYHGRTWCALQRSQKDTIYLRAACMYEKLASDVTIKLYWSRCPFLKTHQPYLWSWKANSCNSSFSLQDAKDNTDENLSMNHNYKHGNTLNTPGFLWDQRVPAHQVNLVFPKMKTCRVSISNSHRTEKYVNKRTITEYYSHFCRVFLLLGDPDLLSLLWALVLLHPHLPQRPERDSSYKHHPGKHTTSRNFQNQIDVNTTAVSPFPHF